MKTLILLSTMLLTSCSVSWNETSTPPPPTKYRLMCWLPNGVAFYDGTATKLDPRKGWTQFVPNEGPQAGQRINTTCPCTWMKLEN